MIFFKKIILEFVLICFSLFTIGAKNYLEYVEYPLNGELCSSIKYENIGINKKIYSNIFTDGKLTDSEREYLYKNYYTPSPKIMRINATLYGSDLSAIGELLQYGTWIRQQMNRGWVLIGSGEYGYHPDLKDELNLFIHKYYGEIGEKDPSDTLLSKQKSPLYFYFADGGVDWNNRDILNQPIPVKYDELNSKQKRVYDITGESVYKIKKDFFVSIDEQSKLIPEDAIKTNKYIAVVSSKSINDFGRKYLLYSCENRFLKFIGVVLIGGEAKRDDWTGLGSPTNPNFDLRHFPLSIRENNSFHWGMDLPLSVYNAMGGKTGATRDFIAIEAID